VHKLPARCCAYGCAAGQNKRDMDPARPAVQGAGKCYKDLVILGPSLELLFGWVVPSPRPACNRRLLTFPILDVHVINPCLHQGDPHAAASGCPRPDLSGGRP
jgi:hypothetical protein